MINYFIKYKHENITQLTSSAAFQALLTQLEVMMQGELCRS